MANEKRLIDANALLDKVQFRLHIDNQNAEVIAGCVDITRRLIENAPTVDAVEVVHGYNTGRARWFECSVCGYGFDDIFLLDESDDMMEPKYCGHCGAKMDGERKDNERKAD